MISKDNPYQSRIKEILENQRRYENPEYVKEKSDKTKYREIKIETNFRKELERLKLQEKEIDVRDIAMIASRLLEKIELMKPAMNELIDEAAKYGVEYKGPNMKQEIEDLSNAARKVLTK